MASGKKVLLDRGDGHLFKMSESRAQAYMKRHRSAFVRGARGQVVATPEPLKAPGPDYESLSVAQLREMASDTGVDLSGLNKKADIIARLRGDQVEGEEGDASEDKGGAGAEDNGASEGKGEGEDE